VGAAAALANLEIFAREQLVERADRIGALLQTRLRERWTILPRYSQGMVIHR